MIGQSVTLWTKIKEDIKTAVSRLFDKRTVITTGDGVVTVEDDMGNVTSLPQLRGILIRPGDDVLVLSVFRSEIVIGPISMPGVPDEVSVPPHEHPGPSTNTTRLGTGAEASYVNATAIGVHAKAGLLSTAVGNDANAEKVGSVVVGQFSGAGDEFATVLGQFAFANGKRSFVVGQGALTDVDDRGVLRANEVVVDRSDGVTGSTRFGLRDASGVIHWIGVTGSNITFDGSPVSGGGGSVSWGSILGTLSNQTDLQNALNGKSNVGHQHAAGDITSGTFADARIPNLNASKITAGTFADARIPMLPISKITNLQSTLDGKAAANHQHAGTPGGSVQLGNSAVAGGVFDTVIGTGASTSTGGNATAIGNASSANGINATALGFNASATNNYGLAIGPSSQATNLYATALGTQANASGDRSTALGVAAEASGLRSVAIGREAEVTEDDTGEIRVNRLRVVKSDGVPGASELALTSPDATTGVITVTNDDRIAVNGNLPIYKSATRSGSANASASWATQQGTTFASAVTNISTADGYDPSRRYLVTMSAEIYCTTTAGNEVAIAPKREDLSSLGIAGFTRAITSMTGEQRISASWTFELAPNELVGGNGVPANNLRCQIQMWCSATTGVSIRDGKTSIYMQPIP